MSAVVLSSVTLGCGGSTPDPTPVVDENGQEQEDCDGMLEAYNLKRVGSYDGAGEAFHHWDDAGVSASHRNDTWIAIASEPAVADTEYISLFAAGQQNALEFGAGYRATATGQFNKWRKAIDTGGPDDDINTCKHGMLGRTKYDEGYQSPGESFSTKRNPVDRTFAAAVFDTQLQWGAGEWEQITDAYFEWLKSKGDPARIKGIYLLGSSRGGCLVMMLASRFQNETSDGGLWKKVPIIVQGFDPVCNGSHSGEMSVTEDTRDNPLHDGDDPGSAINSSDYFAYKTNDFGDYFPQTNKIAIHSLIGGGKVITGSKARTFAYLDDSGDIFNGSLVWFRQKWVDMAHPAIGRSWHHTITLDAMTWWRSNYNYFNMWGTEVYFPFLETEINETGLGTTVYVPIAAHLGEHDRDLGVHIRVLPSSTATYGVDYTIAGAASEPDFVTVTVPPFSFGAMLEVQILYSSGVEPYETINLRIGEHPILGKAGLYGGLKDYTITIKDKDTVPFTQDTCEAAGGVWDPVSMLCVFKSAKYDEPACLGDIGGWDGDTTECTLQGEPVRIDTCPDASGIFTWAKDSDHCVLQPPLVATNELECVTLGAAWREASGRCEKPQTPLNSVTCDALGSEAGKVVWNEQAGACTVLGLNYRQGSCESQGGVWDPAVGTCGLADNGKFESQ